MPRQKERSSITPQLHKPTFPDKKSAPSKPIFPLAQYTSIVGTQTLLLLFTALYLPRSTTSIFGADALPTQKSSLDRPEHPFMVPLTASPEITMTWVCLGTAFVVAWWAGYVRTWAKELGLGPKLESAPGGGKQTSEGSVTEGPVPSSKISNEEKMKSFKGAWKATACATPLFYLAVVLFGAPIVSNYFGTFSLSLLLSLLTVYTPVYALGLPSLSSDGAAVMERLTYTRLFSEFAPRAPIEAAIVYPILGCLFGCGIGAFPIPLDWDRPWQAWPLTPAFGAIAGHAAGSIFCVLSSSAKTLASFDKTD